MEKLKEKVDHFALKARIATGTALAAVGVPALAVIASAEDPTTSTTGLSAYTDQITNQFTSTAGEIIPIIVGVLGAGLGVFAIFIGIKLAKKMFSTVSK